MESKIVSVRVTMEVSIRVSALKKEDLDAVINMAYKSIKNVPPNIDRNGKVGSMKYVITSDPKSVNIV